MPCPTILTRQGNKVSGKGKFGGAHNTAPPMNRLLMFGAPFPQQYHALIEDIGDISRSHLIFFIAQFSHIIKLFFVVVGTDLLTQYKSALQKREQAEQDLRREIEEMKSPETLKKQQKLQEATQQLKEIHSLLCRSIFPVFFFFCSFTFFFYCFFIFIAASTPVRPVKRGSTDAGASSDISAKRGRQQFK